MVAALGTAGRLIAPEPLIIVGSGGFGRETAEAVRAIDAARATPRWELLGFVDDDPDHWGTEVSGTPVLGAIETLGDRPGAALVVCTGHPGNFASKRTIVERLGLPPERYATLVHPAAIVAESATIGPGSVLHAGTVLTADVKLGAHVAVMPAVVLTHDDVVSDGVTFGAGARVAGGVTIERGAYIGAGALLREGLVVGAGAVVGMGAVVTRPVPAGEVWAGIPARRLR